MQVDASAVVYHMQTCIFLTLTCELLPAVMSFLKSQKWRNDFAKNSFANTANAEKT